MKASGEARRAGGRGANRGRRGGGPPWRARASVASLLSCFFFFPFALEPPPAPLRSRAPPAVCALQQRGRGMHVCVCVCAVCAQLPLQARFPRPLHTRPTLFLSSPLHTALGPPPHTASAHAILTHTRIPLPSTPFFRVPAPPCAPSSTPTRPAFRPTPARPTVWAPRAPSPSWCPPAP
jgi:hypothetical protein